MDGTKERENSRYKDLCFYHSHCAKWNYIIYDSEANERVYDGYSERKAKAMLSRLREEEKEMSSKEQQEQQTGSERYVVVEKSWQENKWFDIVDTENNNAIKFCTSIGPGETGRQAAERVIEKRLTELRAEKAVIPSLFIDFDEIDAGTENEKIIWYVMREKRGVEIGPFSVLNSYEKADCITYIESQVTAGLATHATRPYTLEIVKYGDGATGYQVRGDGFYSAFPRTIDGYERASALRDSLNERGDFDEKQKELDKLPVTTDTTGKYVPKVSHTAYVAPTAKEMPEKSPRWLQTHMRGDVSDPYKLLFALCRMGETTLTNLVKEHFSMTDISHLDKSMKEGDLLWRKGKAPKRADGKRVLAVAHRDTVVTTPHENPQYVTYWEGNEQSDSLNDVLVSSCFDDRVGVFTLLYMLPKLGIECDILLTTDEERGDSSAQYFSMDAAKELTGYTGEGSPYSHIIEFDRRGEDVVAYDYEDKSDSWKALEKEMHEAGMIVGTGSFTDIGMLTHLLAKAINIGTGVREEHAPKSYLDVRQYLSNLCRYKKLYDAIVKGSLSFPHEDKGRKARFHSYSGGQGWDGYDSHKSYDKAYWKERDDKEGAKRAKEREEAWLSELNNPDSEVIYLRALPSKHFSSPKMDCTRGLKFEASFNLYVDEVTGDVYLKRVSDNSLYVAEGGELSGK